MLPLISRLLGTAVADFKSALVAAKNSTADFHKFQLDAQAWDASIATAKAAFFNSPSERTYKVWLSLETSKDAAARLVSAISVEAISRQDAALKAVGRGRLVAACSEVLEGLNAREAELRSNDAKRSEELGVPCTSEAAFQAIEKARDELTRAKQWAVSDFPMAVAVLRGVIGQE